MISTALKDCPAHLKAMDGCVGKGGMFLGDYTAADAAIRLMVASAVEARHAAARVRLSARLRAAVCVLALPGVPAAHAGQIDDAA